MKIMNMLADDVVDVLFKAVKHLNNESHLLMGFVRFSIFNNALVAEIEPKNYVLPLLTQHFCERYPEERFLIYDKTHEMISDIFDTVNPNSGVKKLELPAKISNVDL